MSDGHPLELPVLPYPKVTVEVRDSEPSRVYPDVEHEVHITTGNMTNVTRYTTQQLAALWLAVDTRLQNAGVSRARRPALAYREAERDD